MIKHAIIINQTNMRHTPSPSTDKTTEQHLHNLDAEAMHICPFNS